MPRRWICLALLAGWGVAATCRGAIRWYDDYSEGHEVAKKSGRPMVVMFGVEERRRDDRRLLEKEQLAPFHRLFVFIHVELSIRGGQVGHALFQKYPPGAGNHTFPIIFFADTEEKTLSKVEGGQKTGDLATEMASAIKKLGGPSAARKTREAQEALERANALAARKRFGAAARLYKDVIDLNLKLPATEAAKAELAKIEELAKKELEAARADIADRAYAEAAKKLADLDETFSPMAAAREARDELAKLRQNPDAKEALEKAGTKPTLAARTAPKHTDDPADIDNDFFTDEELDALDKMAGGKEAEPAPKQADAGAECRRLLGLARSWIANKQNAKAREILETIIEKHPESLYADQAKALLETLK